MTDEQAWRSGSPHPTRGYDKVIMARGDRLYFTSSKLHRLDGPAVEAEDGSVQFWIQGLRVDEQEWRRRTSR